MEEEKANEAEDNDEDAEDEKTECICGQPEYPGLPPAVDPKRQGPKAGVPSEGPNDADAADDGSGFFVQCDTCKVWQHGRCVGLPDEASTPEEYSCQNCRPELHKISTLANG